MTARTLAFAAALPAAIKVSRELATCGARARRAPVRMGARKAASEADAVHFATLRGVDKSVAEHAVAAVVRASRGVTGVSEFMSPNDAHEVFLACKRSLPDARVVQWGGYPDAERAVLTAGHIREFENDDAVLEAVRDRLAAVVMRWKFEGEKLSQRDFLGAVLAHVKRERVGDVVLGENKACCYAVVHADVADYLLGAITSVGCVGVETSLVALDKVTRRERRVKEFTTVEKSLRLDAVGSAGFGISRSKMADGIRNGAVKINHREISSPAKTVKAGDIISLRGMGRVEIGECASTRKGNIRINILRYL